MDFSVLRLQADEEEAGSEQRAAPRFVSLIRAAKLILPQGEFVCVIRDVSASGLKVRTFHALPPMPNGAVLELQNGEQFALQLVRDEDGEASFTFRDPVEVDRLIKEHWSHPKRQFRLSICLPATLHTLTATSLGSISNISQQGARLSSDALFARDEMLRIEAPELPEIRAKVRWRRNGEYGVVFENTFRLAEIAHLAARLQCPNLL